MNHLRVDYEPCVICGFDLYTEQHHIHLKEKLIVIRLDGKYVVSYKKIRNMYYHKYILKKMKEVLGTQLSDQIIELSERDVRRK